MANEWEWELQAEKKWFQYGLVELWRCRGLLQSFVRKELTAGYQQTIMGVFWLVIQPLLTTLFYFLVFSKIVKVSTDGAPPLLFYMSGALLWGYFSDCLTSTMYSFIHNAHIFNKVYFPRLIVPLSMVITHSVRTGIQFILFLIIYVNYWIFDDAVHPSQYIWLMPLMLFFTALLGLGLGMIVAVFMAKYRDLEQLMNFMLRLFMFVTPVVYPASIVPEKYKVLFWCNPLTPVIETFRLGFLHGGTVDSLYIFTGMASSLLVFFIGLTLFKFREIKVMDTI
jgi:lipopolysaccharide transport system permease protein